MKITQLIEKIGVSRTDAISVDIAPSPIIIILLLQSQKMIQLKFLNLMTLSENTFKGEIVEDILSGRVMLIPGGKSIVEQGTDAPTLIADPFKSMLKPLKESAETLKKFPPARLLTIGELWET